MKVIYVVMLNDMPEAASESHELADAYVERLQKLHRASEVLIWIKEVPAL